MEDGSEEMSQSKAQTKKKMKNMKKRVKDMARRMKKSSMYFAKSSKGRINTWKRDDILRDMSEVVVELMINVNIQVKEGY